MQKNPLKKCLLIMPIIVLFLTLFYLNYSVQHLKDTAYTFVYNSNVESVQRFSRELKNLSSQGYTRDIYGSLYTDMIYNYNNTLGEKEAIVSFLMSEEKEIHHSNDYNQTYLSELLKNEENRRMINAAYASRNNGEITLDRNGTEEIMYYHSFYSGTHAFSMFICVDNRVIEANLHANRVIVPICIVGVLLLLLMEHIIWLKMIPLSINTKERKDDNAD